VRWERSATLSELLARADGLLGIETATVRATAGDRWIDLDVGHEYLLEVAYPFARDGGFGTSVLLRDRADLGVHVLAEGGRIAEVSFALHSADNDDAVKQLQAAMRTHWGRPRTKYEETWTWRTSDRTVTADLASYTPQITIRKR